MRHFAQITQTHHHAPIEGLSQEERKDKIKAEAHSHREQVNHSLKILRTTTSNPEKRTHVQIVKERLSIITKLTKKYSFVTVSLNSLSKVEHEIHKAEISLKEELKIPNPAELITEIKKMKEAGQYRQVESLLIHCITSSEESTTFGAPVWYYEQLAEVFHLQDAYAKEVATIERYLRKEVGPNQSRSKLYKMLDEARKLSPTK